MDLKVLSTGSSGNCYILENGKESLIIECGVSIKKIKKGIDFNLKKLKGVLITHEHGDHSKSIKDVMASGINVYATAGTHKACGTTKHHRAKILKSKQKTQIGEFTIFPFDIKHDAEEPVGFIIKHEECGNTLFLTDTVYSPYKFANLNNIIIEVNFSEEIIDKKLIKDSDNAFLRNRIIQSHFSLENAIKLFSVNDLSKVNNIVLMHLSDTNSDEALFKKTIEKETGKTVHIADDNMNINLDKRPF